MYAVHIIADGAHSPSQPASVNVDLLDDCAKLSLSRNKYQKIVTRDPVLYSKSIFTILNNGSRHSSIISFFRMLQRKVLGEAKYDPLIRQPTGHFD
jgi:hypothetical protein